MSSDEPQNSDAAAHPGPLGEDDLAEAEAAPDPDDPKVCRESFAGRSVLDTPSSDADADADADAGPEPEPEPGGAGDAEAQKYLQLAQRTQADFENFRKRAARDQQAAEARGVGRVLKELIPALDNFERALAAAEAEEQDEEHHLTKGIRLVQSDLLAALGRVGIEPFSPKGEAFDPNEHEAMAQAPMEGFAPGVVAEVYQQGYRLNGAVLRPAKVVVAA